jgi:E3 ubiquitin-protein ligase HUWE1
LRQQLFGGRPQTVPAKKVVQKREAVQLLDKAGVTTLVRLLFFPPPLKKSALQNILIHLCENGRTRVELINLLLGILYDGTKDAGGGAIVDRTFSQMSLSKTGKLLSKGKGPSTPAATPSAVPVTPGSNPYAAAALSAAPSGDAVPHLPVQRSLEALAYLVAANDASAAYFLTEQDLTINLAKDGPGKKAPGTGRKEKGKGKERENSQSKEKNYPIVVLLALLDRESLTKSPSIMEALTKLLAHITVPLRQLDQEATPNSEMTVTPSQSAGDVQTTVSTSQPASASVTSSASLLPLEIPPDNIQEAEKKEDKKEDPRLVKSAPRLPATYVKMVVNILDLGECSSKMFSAALSLIHNLWYLPEARDIISSELIILAQRYGKDLIEDLGELESILARGETATSSSTLGKFSQASSKQAKILRVLKTLEHAKQQQAKMLKKKKAELEAKQKEEEERKKAEEAKTQPKDGPSTAVDGTAEKKPADALAVQVPSVEEVPILNKVDELYNGFDFSPLWSKLSDCLTVIEKNDDVSNAGTLLPLIEAFLLVSSW